MGRIDFCDYGRTVSSGHRPIIPFQSGSIAKHAITLQRNQRVVLSRNYNPNFPHSSQPSTSKK